MTNLDKETSEIAKEKRKQRAKERLNSLSGGDITRGLNSGVKERGLVSDTYSTQQAKAKVGAKAQAQKAKSTSTTAKKTTSSSKSSSKSDEKAKNSTARKTKATAVNVDVFEDDILLEEEKKGKKSKKALGSIVVDESALENISTVTTDRRSRRNKVVISTLVVAIVAIWIAVLIMLLVKPKPEEPNCFIELGGNASSSCEVLLNNSNMQSWLAPAGIAQGSIYTMDLDLKIKQSGTYFVRFRVELTNNGRVIQNAVEITPTSEEISTDGNGVDWYVYENVQGNSTLELINSFTITIDWANDDLVGLSDNNAVITFYVDVYAS